MTYCIPDETPDDWFKTKFQTRFMSKVNEYFSETKPEVKLSGAVTYNEMLEQISANIMGNEFSPMKTTASFKNKEEHDIFVKWYTEIETKNTPDDYVIVFSDTLKDE